MAKARSLSSTTGGAVARPPYVQQFLIVLSGTDPLVWRRLQVPESYSFWDLHVAIQDAMGWLDYHLHEFRLVAPSGKRLMSIGIPDDEDEFPGSRPVKAGWKEPLARHFEYRTWDALPIAYLYDFGDNWQHVVVHEGLQHVDPSASYPRCVAGSRKGPPEDCGGPDGFARFLEAIADPTHPEHDEMVQWSGGTYDPDDFRPEDVVFDDPRHRWRMAFT